MMTPTSTETAARGRAGRVVRGAVAALVASLAVGVCLPAAAGASPMAPAPQLSIALDDGHGAAAAGDVLDYRLTVINLGADAVKGLRVTQVLPEGLAFGSADAQGAHRAGTITWKVDLGPNQTKVVRSTAAVGTTDDEVLRLASIGCATTGPKAPPLVCATDSDRLPAGRAADAAAAKVAAAKAQAATERASAASSSSDGFPFAVAAAGVLAAGLVLAGVVVLVRRSRRPGFEVAPGGV